MGLGFSRRAGKVTFAGLAGLWLCSGSAFAQLPPPSASGALPTREELQQTPVPPEPSAPRLKITGDIERSPCPLADPRYANITVPVNAVTFNNLKGVTAEEMRPAWEAFKGTSQPIAVLCEIRDAAASILRQRGYLAAVQVPTQRIENGEIRMEMLYARIVAIRARGQTGGAERMIARYLGRLAEDEIFDRNRAERYLLLARELPGYNVQLTLKPAGTGPGELVGEVTVLRRPYTVDGTIQNLSSEAVGRWGFQVRAQFFGLTGMGDATTLSAYSTSDFEEQQIVQIGHEFRVGGEGVTINAQLTHAWTEPDIGGQGFNAILRAKTLYASLGASYPIIRRQAHSVTASGGLDFVNQMVDFIAPVSRDRLRVFYAKLSGEAIDLAHQMPQWRFSGNLELRKGLTILDASDCGLACPAGRFPSRFDGDAGAALIRGSGVAEVTLGKSLALSVAPRFQFAFDPVFAFEEFSGGNYSVGRGFDPGVISGDSGIGAAVELHGPTIIPRQARDLSLSPYAFVDGAQVWNKNVGLAASSSRGLLSVGGGVRAAYGDRLQLDAKLALPVDEPLDAAGVRASRSLRFLLSLTTRFLPWSASR